MRERAGEQEEKGAENREDGDRKRREGEEDGDDKENVTKFSKFFIKSEKIKNIILSHDNMHLSSYIKIIIVAS